MRLVRPGIVGAAVLLALHVFMLAGVDIGHPRPATIAVTMDHGEPHDAAAVAPPTPGHPMAVACLAVLAGLLLWQMRSGVARRRLQPLAVTPAAAPVMTPPTPPPIALGISQT
jgi:hypothetical protein